MIDQLAEWTREDLSISLTVQRFCESVVSTNCNTEGEYTVQASGFLRVSSAGQGYYPYWGIPGALAALMEAANPTWFVYAVERGIATELSPTLQAPFIVKWRRIVGMIPFDEVMKSPAVSYWSLSSSDRTQTLRNLTYANPKERRYVNQPHRG